MIHQGGTTRASIALSLGISRSSVYQELVG
ncbi:helix-turn-helix domain-containing protein [Mycobacterium gordonae]